MQSFILFIKKIVTLTKVEYSQTHITKNKLFFATGNVSKYKNLKVGRPSIKCWSYRFSRISGIQQVFTTLVFYFIRYLTNPRVYAAVNTMA